MIKNQLNGLAFPIVVIGLGKSGNSSVKLLNQYFSSDSQLIKNIYTFDEKNPAPNQQNLSSWNDINQLSPGTLIISPGIHLKKQEIQHLVQLGWKLYSEISLASLFLTDEICIGITGSVAKSTVTTLIGEAVKTDDPHSFIGGNLGIPFCEYALSLLNNQPKARFIVLELSSYQLENCQGLKLDYSLITFLSANHLERYDSLKEYYFYKLGILNLTKIRAFINSKSPEILNYLPQFKLNNPKLPVDNVSEVNSSLNISHMNLIGTHNEDNMRLALALVQSLNLSINAQNKMIQYSGLPHRLQIVQEHHQITYINDSKATSMDSVQVAVEAALTKNKNILWLLLGGKDKNLPWEQLQYLVQLTNIKIIFFGQCGLHAQEKMNAHLSSKYYLTLKEAIHAAYQSAQKGDVILLSPGGTSLDEFKNFEDRGTFFSHEIKSLIQKNG